MRSVVGKKTINLVVWLVGFNGISTSIDYLMPKPVYTYVRRKKTYKAPHNTKDELKTSWLVGWLVILFYIVSTLFLSFNAESSHFDKGFKQFSLVKVQFFSL